MYKETNQVLKNDRESTNNTLINDLLNDKSYHIEFNGHLTNHAKHAVIALAGLGQSPEKIKDYYQDHAKETAYGFGLEKPKRSKHIITQTNWLEFLGKRTSYSSYCDFFTEELENLGVTNLLEKYMPVLIKGWVGSFTHATIHLGWALSVSHHFMIIEGVAYMAFSYVSCHPERINTDNTELESSPVESIIRIGNYWEEKKEHLSNWVKNNLEDETSNFAKEIPPELKRSGLQYRIARMLDVGHPLIYERPNWVDNDLSKIWEELYYTTALLYLSKPGDFVILHLITSLYAMERISEHLSVTLQKELLKCYWVGMLGILFSGGSFPKGKKLNALNIIFNDSYDGISDIRTEKNWKQIVERAFLEKEEHNPKLVYVLKRQWEICKGKSIYQVAAGQFTQTPDLPDSFEEEPIEEDSLPPIDNSNTMKIESDNLYSLPQNNLLKFLHTIIRNKEVSRSDFIYYSEIILNQLIEAAFEFFPFEKRVVCTPVGANYEGLRLSNSVCGVSVMRAGESMEIAFRNIFKAEKIGKILIQRNKDTKLPHLYYTALPDGIDQSYVLLMDPMLATGGTAVAALDVLIDNGVKAEKIVFVCLIAVSNGIKAIQKKYPKVKIVTSSVDTKLNEHAYMIPGIGDFGDRYFGTDKTVKN